MRRAYVKNPKQRRMMEEILAEYKKNEELGVYKNDEQIKGKELGGEAASSERGQLRKQCNQQGPVGLLLESLHLQAAVMNDRFQILQYNQHPIDIANAPVQQLFYDGQAPDHKE